MPLIEKSNNVYGVEKHYDSTILRWIRNFKIDTIISIVSFIGMSI